MVHAVKGFGIVNKAEIDVFRELSGFFHDPADVGNLISVEPVCVPFSLFSPFVESLPQLSSGSGGCWPWHSEVEMEANLP